MFQVTASLRVGSGNADQNNKAQCYRLRNYLLDLTQSRKAHNPTSWGPAGSRVRLAVDAAANPETVMA